MIVILMLISLPFVLFGALVGFLTWPSYIGIKMAWRELDEWNEGK